MLELFASDWETVWRGASEVEPVGAIFTKPEIVELILDLAGYGPSNDRLATRPVLEPSCGDGAFLTAVVTRLLASEVRHAGRIKWTDEVLDTAIRAADISKASIEAARVLVYELLKNAGCGDERATELSHVWIVHTDFLLTDWPSKFDFVVGNPPYVRIEDLPKIVLSRYRELLPTTTDRADIYIGFLEKGLRSLSKTGTLAFICANRFAKNKYGAALRRLIAQQYRVRSYINLEHTQPFTSDVSAYPAIVIIDRTRGGSTRAATLADIEPATIEQVRRQVLADRQPLAPVTEFDSWYPKGEPWLTTNLAEHGILVRMSSSLPTLEDSAPGTKVGIGVATGADDVFVLKHKHSGIEESRQIPLLMAANVGNRELCWSGHYLLNPFADADDGSLADFAEYPGFAEYIGANVGKLKKRHCAKGRPTGWYRTIDRIWPRFQNRQKLVIPDIQGATTIGYDDGDFYPHHNLYWITSDEWPLLALKTLLRSSSVRRQVAAWSVQMRGGSLRFQAQTLRRVRIPSLASLSDVVLERLTEVNDSTDQEHVDFVAAEAFGQAAG